MTKYYALKSKTNGKYLTHLLTDYHFEQFTAKKFSFPRHCYCYNIKEIAEEVAKELGAEVIDVTKEVNALGFN